MLEAVLLFLSELYSGPATADELVYPNDQKILLDILIREVRRPNDRHRWSLMTSLMTSPAHSGPNHQPLTAVRHVLSDMFCAAQVENIPPTAELQLGYVAVLQGIVSHSNDYIGTNERHRQAAMLAALKAMAEFDCRSAPPPAPPP